MKTLLGEMEPRDRSSTVREWATGGQVCHKSIVIPVAAIVVVSATSRELLQIWGGECTCV